MPMNYLIKFKIVINTCKLGYEDAKIAFQVNLNVALLHLRFNNQKARTSNILNFYCYDQEIIFNIFY